MIETDAGPVESVDPGGGVGHVQGLRIKTADGTANVPATTDGLGMDLRIVRGSATATVVTVVPDNTSAKVFKAANTVRRGLTIRNQTAVQIAIKFAASPSMTSLTDIIEPYTSWDCPSSYQGVINGVFSAVDATSGAAAHVSEW
jgi:hypothetical protein